MTNEQAKQEAIKKAYGEKWQLVKSLTPNRKDSNDAYDLYYNGFFNSKRLKITNGTITDFFSSELFDFDGKWITPKCIIGLHQNNGWIRIEPDGSNLPTIDIQYEGFKMVSDSTNWQDTINLKTLIRMFWLGSCTHYKIYDRKPPIY